MVIVIIQGIALLIQCVSAVLAIRLIRLTGLDVEENQARRLLNDLDTYRFRTNQQSLDESLVAHQWLTQCFEPVVTARPFAAQRATRVRLCEEDLRAELGVVNGRQSRFTDGTVEVSHTVTSGGDVADLVERFRTIVQECPGP